MSDIVVGKLLYGFRQGNRFAENGSQLQASPWVAELAVTRETAGRYSRIAVALRQKGKPIPTNDIWIAAQAMETGAELLSYDQHFAVVDGLLWTMP